MSLYDWSKAPKWANWAAQESDSVIHFWYENKPICQKSEDVTFWKCVDGKYESAEAKGEISITQASYSIEERPSKMKSVKKSSGNKYLRIIHDRQGKELGEVDVYCVLRSFGVTEPSIQHAIKKLLCAGLRGKGDVKQDLREAIDAIEAGILAMGEE